jgi:hypothetical protein
LVKSALDILQDKWRFKPATSNGIPVNPMTEIEMLVRPDAVVGRNRI